MAAEKQDSHGHVPALRDWPHGYGETSWWPLFTAIGLGAAYIGAALALVGRSTGWIAPDIGLVAFSLGVSILVVGMFGWIYHAFVADFWETYATDGGESLRLGMLFFLGTDVATFGALFAYYFFIRVGTWKTSYLPHSGLLSGLLVINTAALICSSMTLRWAESRLETGDRQNFTAGLVATGLLGAWFVAGELLEYYGLVVHDGFTLTSGFFASAFFTLTGYHALHIVVGVILLGLLVVRARRGQFNADRHVSVTTVSWYWHFVTAGWLFFIAVLYIGSILGTQFSPF